MRFERNNVEYGAGQVASEDDFRVEHVRKARLAPYDKLLKAFNYGAALDAALSTAAPQVRSPAHPTAN